MISVVSYGVGNLGSIFSMLRKIGVPAAPASTPDEIAKAEKLILPGIGAFDHGMETLAERGLIEPLRERVAGGGVPMLGICLGMQLLGTGSEEGIREGLGFIDARSVKFRVEDAPAKSSNGKPARALKIPHMGWKELSVARQTPLTTDLGEAARFYFVHSYHLVCTDPADVLATARYGLEFTAMVQRGNVWGAQFHPEKSHRFGMALLRNFAAI